MCGACHPFAPLFATGRFRQQFCWPFQFFRHEEPLKPLWLLVRWSACCSPWAMLHLLMLEWNNYTICCAYIQKLSQYFVPWLTRALAIYKNRPERRKGGEGMTITIDGTAKEIADLVFALQGQLQNYKPLLDRTDCDRAYLINKNNNLRRAKKVSRPCSDMERLG